MGATTSKLGSKVTSDNANAQPGGSSNEIVNNSFFGNAWNSLDAQNYNYGVRTDFPVAEQTQTYFVYWDGIGGTGPEIIGQTAYFIKYIIDTEGNVVNPEPDSLGSREEAVGLFNLLDNFEVGKKAIVKLIEPDPTIDKQPVGKCLLGTYNITGIGTIRGLMTTETGYGYQNYTETMSFYNPLVPSQEDVPLFRARYTFGETASIWLQQPVTASCIATGDYEEAGWSHTQTGTTTNYTKPFFIFTPETSSADAHTKVVPIFGLQLAHINNPGALGGYGGATNLLLNNSIYFRVVKKSPQGDQSLFGSGWIDDIPSNGTYKWYWLVSNPITVNANDQLVVTAQLGYNASGSGAAYKPIVIGPGTSITFDQKTPPGTEVLGYNTVYSPYWSSVSHTPEENYSSLIFNHKLREIMQSTDFAQKIDPLSELLNFSPMVTPINRIAKGDFIRFEYDRDQVYRIIGANIDSGSYKIDVTPCLIPSSSVTCSMELNHFTIYRLDNDGRYVILDVPRDSDGTAYSGIMQAQYSSKELLTKYEKIITDLTEREIIQ